MTEEEIKEQCEALWDQDKKLTFQSLGKIYEMGFRRGVQAGESAEAKKVLKAATFRESFRGEHFESVQEAQRQTF